MAVFRVLKYAHTIQTELKPVQSVEGARDRFHAVSMLCSLVCVFISESIWRSILMFWFGTHNKSTETAIRFAGAN